jgi:altronate dehydratase large subunit
MTSLATSGCNLILFTTGRGTPVGSPLAVTLKVTATRATADKMAENMDLSLADAVANGTSADAAADEVVRGVIEAANGRPTKAELLGHWEVAIPIRGVTY